MQRWRLFPVLGNNSSGPARLLCSLPALLPPPFWMRNPGQVWYSNDGILLVLFSPISISSFTGVRSARTTGKAVHGGVGWQGCFKFGVMPERETRRDMLLVFYCCHSCIYSFFLYIFFFTAMMAVITIAQAIRGRFPTR